MRKQKWIVWMGLVVFLLCGSVVWAATDNDVSTSPKTNDGKKWRVGYYEGGEYIEYRQTLLATIKGLMELGWIEPEPLPEFKKDQMKEIWEWLANTAKSKYIDFVNDAYYSSDWSDAKRKEIAGGLIERLNQKKDIDLMIAMGTWAAQDLANNDHQVPTLAMAVSDAVSSGIVKSIDDSGFDHFHARVDPFRYERQVRIFHDIIGFQKLGLVYEDTVRGRSYASIDKVQKVASERDFSIISCHITKGVEDVKVAENDIKNCFRELIDKVDAIYVTLHMGINEDSLPELVEIANEGKIPTFSQAGSEEVKYGLLMSISQAEFKYVGSFHADTMAKVFNGATPRQLNQIFEDPPKIAINLKTAEVIGYDPPVDVLGAADEIYQEIRTPEK